jgi:hypothetical protein
VEMTVEAVTVKMSEECEVTRRVGVPCCGFLLMPEMMSARGWVIGEARMLEEGLKATRRYRVRGNTG